MPVVSPIFPVLRVVDRDGVFLPVERESGYGVADSELTKVGVKEFGWLIVGQIDGVLTIRSWDFGAPGAPKANMAIASLIVGAWRGSVSRCVLDQLKDGRQTILSPERAASILLGVGSTAEPETASQSETVWMDADGKNRHGFFRMEDVRRVGNGGHGALREGWVRLQRLDPTTSPARGREGPAARMDFLPVFVADLALDSAIAALADLRPEALVDLRYGGLARGGDVMEALQIFSVVRQMVQRARARGLARTRLDTTGRRIVEAAEAVEDPDLFVERYATLGGESHGSGLPRGVKALIEILGLYHDAGGVDGGRALVEQIAACEAFLAARSKLMERREETGLSFELYAAGPEPFESMRGVFHGVRQNQPVDKVYDDSLRAMLELDIQDTLVAGGPTFHDSEGLVLNPQGGAADDLFWRRFSLPVFAAGANGGDVVISLVTNVRRGDRFIRM